MKYLLVYGLILIIFSCNNQSGNSSNDSENKEVINIGAILPLTGSGAQWGNNTKNGIKTGLKYLKNNTNTNLRLNLIFKDSKGEAKTGVSVARSLINNNNVSCIIDDAVSSVALANIPVITENKIPMISTGSSSPELTGSSKYFVRLWNSDLKEASVSAKFSVNHLNASTASILYIQNDYGEGLKDRFKEKFADLNGKVISTHRFAKDETNFRSQAVKIKSKKPDFVYVVAYPNNLPSLLNSFHTISPSITIIGTAAFHDPETLKKAGKAAEEVYFPYPKEPQKTNKREKFLKLYNKIYAESPGSPAAEGFDAVLVLNKAIKNVGTDPDKIMKYLHDNKFSGASGIINFKQNGNVSKPMKFLTFQNGKIISVQNRIK